MGLPIHLSFISMLEMQTLGPSPSSEMHRAAALTRIKRHPPHSASKKPDVESDTEERPQDPEIALPKYIEQAITSVRALLSSWEELFLVRPKVNRDLEDPYYSEGATTVFLLEQSSTDALFSPLQQSVTHMQQAERAMSELSILTQGESLPTQQTVKWTMYVLEQQRSVLSQWHKDAILIQKTARTERSEQQQWNSPEAAETWRGLQMRYAFGSKERQ